VSEGRWCSRGRWWEKEKERERQWWRAVTRAW